MNTTPRGDVEAPTGLAFDDRDVRKSVSRAIGQELRRIREGHEWSRAEFVERLPSGIGDRTLLSYEHGTRDMTMLRYLELCEGFGADPVKVLGFALRQAELLLENLDLRVDLRVLLDHQNPIFRPLRQWARNKLNRHPDGVATVTPTVVDELADFIGCNRADLAAHLARFIPEADYE